MSFRVTLLRAALLSLAVSGCGGRPDRWDAPFVRGATVGLSGSVAIVDEGRNEVMLLTSPEHNELAVERIRVGKNVVAAVPSRRRDKLFVLSRGEEPRLERDDERPALLVISGDGRPRVEASYLLTDPLQRLALDPAGEWVVAYDQGGVVVNVNELILVDVRDPEAEPVPITISSTGGQPERFTFTPPLTLANGERHRLLVIETNQDVTVLDLDDPAPREFTVPLPRTKSGAIGQPAQVVFHDSTSADMPSYLAVRLQNDTNVLTLRLGEPEQGSAAAFSLVPNIVDAGGPPSTIDFVETGELERGLRLAAIVPLRTSAVLFDPATSTSEVVEFDQAYTGLARVTSFVAQPPESGDVALLYSASAPSIAFWRLGAASSTPYASFESYTVENRVSAVLDVPGEAFDHLKLLTSAAGDAFFLLDLESRQSHPMRARASFQLELAPDGRRAWAFARGSREFAQLDFASKHPMTLEAERPIEHVFDVERSADGGRTAIVLHAFVKSATEDAPGDLAVTLFDAEQPDSADTRFVSGLALEGL